MCPRYWRGWGSESPYRHDVVCRGGESCRLRHASEPPDAVCRQCREIKPDTDDGVYQNSEVSLHDIVQAIHRRFHAKPVHSTK